MQLLHWRKESVPIIEHAEESASIGGDGDEEEKAPTVCMERRNTLGMDSEPEPPQAAPPPVRQTSLDQQKSNRGKLAVTSPIGNHNTFKPLSYSDNYQGANQEPCLNARSALFMVDAS